MSETPTGPIAQRAGPSGPPVQSSIAIFNFLSTERLFCAIFLLAVVTAVFFAGTDSDYWWHAKNGELAVQRHALVHHDVYSFTAAGKEREAHEWLSEVLIYLVQSVGGYGLAVLLFGLAIAAVQFVALRMARREGLDLWLAVLLTGWGATLTYPFWKVRPQVLGLLFFALVFSSLTSFEQERRKRLWLLPPLMLLWANLHGGYVIGIAVLAVFTVAAWMRARIPGENWRSRARHISLILALCIGGALITPMGYRLVLYPFRYLSPNDPARRYVTEWQSPNFHMFFVLSFLLGLLALIAAGVKPRRERIGQSLAVLIIAAMSLYSVRNLFLFPVVAIPTIAYRLTSFPRLVKNSQSSFVPLRVGQTNTLLIFMALAVSVSLVAFQGNSQARRAPLEEGYPSGGVAFLQHEGIGNRMFNNYGWGGYLVYKLYPDRRVFADGRQDLYGSQFWEEYVEVAQMRPGWRAVLDRYQIDTVFVDKNTPIAAALKGQLGWRLRYSGPIEVIYTRDVGG